MRLLNRCIGLILLAISSLVMAKDPGQPIRHFNTNQKVVALTFDDGPGVPYTRQILDILDKYQVKATFYVLGISAKTHPELIKEMIQKGHDIGNHSTQHDLMKKWPVAKIKTDIQKTDHILRELGYQGQITYRGPFGVNTENIAKALNELNKPHILFDFLPQDWTPISADEIYQNVITRLRPGLIITLHDGGKRRQQTVIATEKLIKSLNEQGYQFKTVSELMPFAKK